MKKFLKYAIFSLFLIVVLFVSCSFNQNYLQTGEITLVSWNLQTFFDATTHGTEYDEFLGSKSEWSEEKYKSRLKLLCKFIQETNADVYAFCELENEQILQDIANNINSTSIKGSDWQYAAFAKNEQSAFGNAVLSKIPLEHLSIHNIDFSVNKPNPKSVYTELNQPKLRPLLKVELCAKNEKIVLFVCHWKSKSGGEAESRIWRDYQENMLCYQVLLCNQNLMPTIICGDFNKDFYEFEQSGDFTILHGDDENAKVFSVWNKTAEKGTYYYRGEWSKIDNFFYTSQIVPLDFKTLQYDYLITENGFPQKYNVSSGKGASDHLPILFRFKVVK